MHLRTIGAAATGAACATFLAVALTGQVISHPGGGAQWPLAGHDLNGSRSQSAEHQINTRNAKLLAPKWSFTTGGDVSATPTVAGGTVYFPDWAGNLYAVTANTGQLVWSHAISEYNHRPGSIARVSPAIAGNTVVIGDNVSQAVPHDGAHIIAVDRNSGGRLWITTVDSHPAAIITGSPVVSGNKIYVGVSSNEEALATNPAYPCCTFRGSLMALDLATGAILWKTYTVPSNGGQPGGYSGNAIWGPVAVGNGSIYTATGNNYTVPDAVALCQAGNPNASNCTADDDYFETAMAVDPSTGSIKWANRLSSYDAWTVACITRTGTCPSPAGPDYDFGDGPNLIGNRVGFGQKSGIYWLLNASNGSIIWGTPVGPGGTLGGIEWGSATDGQRIYVAIGNNSHTSYTLANAGPTINWGSWAALDIATGKILWQVADPTGAMDPGAVSVANGVVYAGSFGQPAGAPSMHALDAATGGFLFHFASTGSVIDGPSIVNGTVFWGSGYSHIAPGLPDNKVYAFTINGQ